MNFKERKRSSQLYEEAKRYFPGGVHSPVRAFKSVEGPPLFIKKGKGATIVDEDENEYIDFCCSWGPLILGHAHEEVISEISNVLQDGTSFGTPSKLGNILGKLIVDHHQYIDKIRFVSSGTEAVMSAIRLARGYTGKSKVVKFEGCYHGHVDALLVKAGSGLATFGVSTSAGIPEAFAKETLVLPLDDIEAVASLLKSESDDIACVIIEPIPANNGLLLQDHQYLLELRELCSQHGVLLIFDEVISGFRVGLEGAAGWYNIKPDIITFGKIIGGGMPVGAYASNHQIMSFVAPDGPVYQAGTLSANPIAMAAGYATLKQLHKPGFYEDLSKKTEYFVKKINDHCHLKTYDLRMVNIGSIFWFSFSKEAIKRADQIDSSDMDVFKQLHIKLLKNGVYLAPSGYEVGFISAVHELELLEHSAAIICDCLDEVMS